MSKETAMKNRGVKTLVTGAARDAGSPTVERLLKKDFQVRALVREDDERAAWLRKLGAEVVFGDLLTPIPLSYQTLSIDSSKAERRRD